MPISAIDFNYSLHIPKSQPNFLNNPDSKKVSEKVSSVYFFGGNEKKFTSFNRYGLPLDDPFSSSIGRVFVTRPDMNIKENIAKSPFLTNLEASQTGRNILASLSRSYTNANLVTGKFMNLLQNSILNFETKDTTLETIEHGENFYGTKLVSAGTSIKSETVDTINFNIIEDSDTTKTNLLTAWIDYISNVKLGIYQPYIHYADNMIIDYAVSFFFFLFGPDGHEIKYCTKLIGAFPTAIPFSAYSWELGENPSIKKLTVPFSYNLRRDNNPNIISDFCELMGTPIISSSSPNLITYKEDISDNWKGKPTIVYNQNTNKFFMYQL